jgi:hypothetical protein
VLMFPVGCLFVFLTRFGGMARIAFSFWKHSL